MIRKLILLTLFCGILNNLHSQEEQLRITTLSDSLINNSGASKLIFTDNIEEAKKLALEDIKKNVPFLLINGGFAPSFSIDQIKFEEKYKIFYYRFGCSAPKENIIETYNFVILDYIKRTYGKNCVDMISKDVFEFKKWKKISQ